MVLCAPGLRVVVPPVLSIFTFKLERAGLSPRDVDLLNVAFLRAIHDRGNVLLSPFRSIHGVAGELSIRMAILSHRTDVDTVDTAVRDIVAAANELCVKTNVCE